MELVGTSFDNGPTGSGNGNVASLLVWRCRPFYAARFFDYLAALAVKGSGHIRKLNLCELQHQSDCSISFNCILARDIYKNGCSLCKD